MTSQFKFMCLFCSAKLRRRNNQFHCPSCQAHFEAEMVRGCVRSMKVVSCGPACVCSPKK